MRIDELWKEMEAETQSDVGWLTRLARPESGYPLYIAIEQTNRTRAILLPVDRKDLPQRREWPDCSGLELSRVALTSGIYFCVRLRESAFVDIFSAFVQDLGPRIGICANGKKATLLLIERMRLWQRFLKSSTGLLSVEQQKGLWGELHTLLHHMIPGYGGMVAVAGWKGGAAAHQDFQFAASAIEVKTTSAKQPVAVRVTSERQLDSTGIPRLFLHVLVVDQREVEPGSDVDGQTLSGIIAQIREKFQGETITLLQFNDLLIQAGWLDHLAARYEDRCWNVRAQHTFHIATGFPRITETDLPEGVSDVKYTIGLEACQSFEVNQEAMYSHSVQDSSR